MVLGVAKQSGGTVEIETQPGHGTSVRVYLPRAARGSAEAPATGDTRAGDAAPLGACVLLVDDDLDVREITAAQLEALGCVVVEAPNGRAALDLIEERGADSFDLLVTDFAMPGMSGADLAREVRRRRPGLPVLMITGFADARTGGAPGEESWGWLPKPFRQNELADRVRDALGGHVSRSNIVPLKPGRA
jgi:CheY-like chemotaxis protein